MFNLRGTLRRLLTYPPPLSRSAPLSTSVAPKVTRESGFRQLDVFSPGQRVEKILEIFQRVNRGESESQVVRDLVRHGVEGVPTLCAILKSPLTERWVGCVAARALGGLVTRDALGTLSQVASDDRYDWSVRVSAIGAIGGLGHQGVEPLLEILSDDANRIELRLASTKALGRTFDVRALPSLLQVARLKSFAETAEDALASIFLARRPDLDSFWESARGPNALQGFHALLLQYPRELIESINSPAAGAGVDRLAAALAESFEGPSHQAKSSVLEGQLRAWLETHRFAFEELGRGLSALGSKRSVGIEVEIENQPELEIRPPPTTDVLALSEHVIQLKTRLLSAAEILPSGFYWGAHLNWGATFNEWETLRDSLEFQRCVQMACFAWNTQDRNGYLNQKTCFGGIVGFLTEERDVDTSVGKGTYARVEAKCASIALHPQDWAGVYAYVDRLLEMRPIQILQEKTSLARLYQKTGLPFDERILELSAKKYSERTSSLKPLLSQHYRRETRQVIRPS